MLLSELPKDTWVNPVHPEKVPDMTSTELGMTTLVRFLHLANVACMFLTELPSDTLVNPVQSANAELRNSTELGMTTLVNRVQWLNANMSMLFNELPSVKLVMPEQ